jgi:hypothetical protein
MLLSRRPARSMFLREVVGLKIPVQYPQPVGYRLRMSLVRSRFYSFFVTALRNMDAAPETAAASGAGPCALRSPSPCR